MFWIFLVSLIILVFLTLLKIWETKRLSQHNQKIWLFWFLRNQDLKLQNLFDLISAHAEKFKKRLKFFVFVHLPYLAGSMIRKTVVRLIDGYHDMKENIRGRIKIRSERIDASPFLREIAKIKSHRPRRESIVK